MEDKLEGAWGNFGRLLQAQSARKYLYEFMRDQGLADPEAEQAIGILMPNIPDHHKPQEETDSEHDGETPNDDEPVVYGEIVKENHEDESSVWPNGHRTVRRQMGRN